MKWCCISFGLVRTVSPSAVGYITLGSTQALNTSVAESITALPIRSSYTWSELFINIVANTLAASSTLKSRVNASDGNQAISIPSSTTGILEDLSNSDSLSSGDEVDYQFTAGAGGTNIQYQQIMSSIESASGIAIQGSVNSTAQSAFTAATRYFFPVSFYSNTVGSGTLSSSIPVGVDVNLSNLLVKVITWGGDTSTVDLIKNGSASGMAVSIIGTGIVEDTTSNIAYAVNDTIEYLLTRGGAGTLSTYTCFLMNCDHEFFIGQPPLNNSNATLDRFEPINGANTNTTTESVAQVYLRDGIHYKFFTFYLSQNTYGSSKIVALNVNGSNYISVSVPATTTGVFTEFSTEYISSGGDLVNYYIGPGTAFTFMGPFLTQLNTDTPVASGFVQVGGVV